MRTIRNLVIPFKTISKRNILILVSVEILFALVFMQSFGGVLIPAPSKIIQSLWDILVSKTFYHNLISSTWLTLKGMFISIFISMVLSYSFFVPILKPIVKFITKCRYLTLTGLIFLFTLLTNDGSQLKISLLVFGIVPFFVTSLLSIFEGIDPQEFELCKTLRMQNTEILWEVIIIGRLDMVFEVIRQNFAISWMMITMVEGLSMSEGGLGTMLIKANKYIDLSSVFSILFIILLIGILFDKLFGLLRKWLFPYIR